MKRIIFIMTLAITFLLTGCSNKVMETAKIVKEEINVKYGTRLKFEITELKKVKDEGKNSVHMYVDDEVVFILTEGSMKEMYVLGIVKDAEKGIVRQYDQMPITDLLKVIRTQLGKDLFQISLENQLGF